MKKTENNWEHKDLIGIENLSIADIRTIFDQARFLKKVYFEGDETLNFLKNKNVCNLFIEPSTRTKLAFEVAAKNLGANCLSLSASTSSFTKGESLRDTALNLKALQTDLIVMRHASAGSAAYLSKIIDIPVINAGDGPHEHPTQALLDSFSILEHCGRDNLDGMNVTIIGDILFSRVARSNILLLNKLGANITLAGPRTLVPDYFKAYGVTISYNREEAVSDADIVMLLRIQQERQTANYFPSTQEFSKLFGLNRKNRHLLKKDAVILHPGPINRGVELDADIAYGPNLILDQVTNGIFIRMAVLYLCARKANIIQTEK